MITDETIKFIQDSEGLRLIPYKDVGDKLTVGWGHLVLPQDNILANQKITKHKADELLRNDIKIAQDGILKMTKLVLNNNQLTALVSFVFNLGVGCYQRSTLRQCLNRGELIKAADEFIKYIHVNGRKNMGLYKRRLREKLLFAKKV